MRFSPECITRSKKDEHIVRAKSATQNAHKDQANQAAVWRLIPPMPRLCCLAPSVTTPFYRTTVFQTLRGGVFSDTRGLRGEEGGITIALYRVQASRNQPSDQASSISRNTPARSAAPILRPASCAYSSSCSAPTNKRPSSFEATPLVPDPQNGSKIRSPSLLDARMARRTRRRGFWVGW